MNSFECKFESPATWAISHFFFLPPFFPFFFFFAAPISLSGIRKPLSFGSTRFVLYWRIFTSGAAVFSVSKKAAVTIGMWLMSTYSRLLPTENTYCKSYSCRSSQPAISSCDRFFAELRRRPMPEPVAVVK